MERAGAPDSLLPFLAAARFSLHFFLSFPGGRLLNSSHLRLARFIIDDNGVQELEAK
jgi:hypothetical protein